MSLAWIVYALAVGALLSVAAWASERLLRSAGRQGRWAWVAAGIGSLVLPLVALTGIGTDVVALVDGLVTLGEGSSGGVELPAATVVTETSAARVEGGWSWSFVPPLSRATELGLFGAWVLASVALLGVYALTWRRLRQRLARWPRAELEGSSVRLTRSTGPAVVGILRPVMMVPAWIRDLPPEERDLVLRHEREHLRAGDSRLLALFPLLVALAPWNLPLWWQVRRLRLAVELDCDARVLADGSEAADYGRLLVAMSHGPEGWIESGGLPLTTAALVERRSDLERRIRTMIESREKTPVLHTATLAALAGLALFVACDTPAPVESDAEPEAEAAEASGTVAPVSEALEEGQPLVVVDGVVRGRDVDIDDLDPSEIESLEVVKGPAAERLYGDLAADGMIHITTKEAAAREGDEADAPGSRSDVIEGRIRLREDTSEMTLRLEDGRRLRMVKIPDDDAGENSSVQLRGITSVGADGGPSKPLIIVDGVVQGDDAALSDLNALDIASIEVVKGPAAERLHGERAADGVIQITTKDAGDGKG
jgi:hypothetical protein